jgi:lipopolysaccharide/colanic/teichoic acid biosynthesis glycosyltransferase
VKRLGVTATFLRNCPYVLILPGCWAQEGRSQLRDDQTDTLRRERIRGQPNPGNNGSATSAPTNHPERANGKACLLPTEFNTAESQIRATLRSVTERDTTPVIPTRYLKLKRACDLLIAIPALILFSPLLLVLAVMIRLDSRGPAIFRQARVGQGGRVFEMLKFRSMTDGTTLLNGPTHKPNVDKRVTRVGRFLRMTSLDELPQIINVIRGDMSLVGPRPEIVEVMLEKYEPWQYRRLTVPQGITGWWQVTGRGRKPLFRHTHDDLYYIERASLWFDTRILLMTVRAVIRRDGAF